MEVNNLWDLYIHYVHNLSDVLLDMEKHGSRIDLEAQKNLRTKLEVEIAELLEKAQKSVPSEVCPTRLWKKEPKDRLVQEVWIPGTCKHCEKCLDVIKGKGDHQKGKQNPCKGAGIFKAAGQVKAWVEVLPFNPLSQKQLIAYCRHFKHQVGKHMKTGNDTVNVKHLQKLQKKYGDSHPIYGITLRIRGLQKVESTYLYEPDANGYAHGHFKNTPSTLRLAQATYNFMNVSHRGTAVYADEIRTQIIPSPGCVFVEADYSALEAVLVGHFMGDQSFIDLARQGIHSWLSCKEFGWEFTPENAKRVKKERKDVYDRAKLTIYLSLYQGGPGMLAGTFPDAYSWETFSGAFLETGVSCQCGRIAQRATATVSPYDYLTKQIRPLVFVGHCEACYSKIPAKFRPKWSTMAIADWEQTKFIRQFPKLPKWWHATKELAQRQGYLQSPWGFKHHYFSVLRPETREKADGTTERILVDGPDANAAVAFQAQHAGGMIGRESLLLFGQTWLRKHMPSSGFVHDGFKFDVPEGRKSECIELVKKILPRPIHQLGGLRIGCEISVSSRSWAHMEPVETVNVQ